jgi:hypothetical protein
VPVVSVIRATPRSLLARRLALPLLAGAAALAWPATVAAQDSSILYPVEYIKQRMLAPELRVTDMDRTRPLEQDRSRRITLAGGNGEPDMVVHLKPVAPPGEGFNNEPRYELAAYRLQQLFLDEPGYVVPPVVLRAMPVDAYRDFGNVTGRTIRGTQSVLFLLSYWLQNLAVDTVDPFDARLFDRDTTYAVHFANANVLTHLIEHKDGNHGNVIVSMDGLNRRVFAVDNDVAFRSQVSDQGDRWKDLVVDRIPATTVERLRGITGEQLRATLGVVAEFEIVDGQLKPVEAGPNLGPNRGVRSRDGRMQFGLTEREIRDLEGRIARRLRDVERGRIKTF